MRRWAYVLGGDRSMVEIDAFTFGNLTETWGLTSANCPDCDMRDVYARMIDGKFDLDYPTPHVCLDCGGAWMQINERPLGYASPAEDTPDAWEAARRALNEKRRAAIRAALSLKVSA